MAVATAVEIWVAELVAALVAEDVEGVAVEWVTVVVVRGWEAMVAGMVAGMGGEAKVEVVEARAVAMVSAAVPKAEEMAVESLEARVGEEMTAEEEMGAALAEGVEAWGTMIVAEKEVMEVVDVADTREVRRVVLAVQVGREVAAKTVEPHSTETRRILRCQSHTAKGIPQIRGCSMRPGSRRTRGTLLQLRSSQVSSLDHSS